ncbi:MAG: hypothetical protein KJO98_10890 [Rhodothermia bacterium]|nr:hypothetical protein [Rhodothermia bacterium]
MKSLQGYRIATLPIVVAILLMGSNGCKHTEENRPMTSEVPSDLKIIFGQQGTFAGRGMGYSIAGSGEVLRWEGKYPEENIEASAVTDSGHIQSLWQRAQEIDFLEMRDQSMSTVHYFVTMTANGESRRVTWVERNEESLTQAQEFYEECRAVAMSALGE